MRSLEQRRLDRGPRELTRKTDSAYRPERGVKQIALECHPLTLTGHFTGDTVALRCPGRGCAARK